MIYSSIDPVLKTWARQRSIPLFTEYRDESIRSFEVVGKYTNLQFQIWVDPPDVTGRTVVHAWVRRHWQVAHHTTVFDLVSALDLALAEIDNFDRSEH
jgi:hypothetical protein